MKLSIIVLVAIVVLFATLYFYQQKEGIKVYKYDTYGAYPLIAKAGESSVISVGSPLSPIAINN